MIIIPERKEPVHVNPELEYWATYRIVSVVGDGAQVGVVFVLGAPHRKEIYYPRQTVMPRGGYDHVDMLERYDVKYERVDLTLV